VRKGRPNRVTDGDAGTADARPTDARRTDAWQTDARPTDAQPTDAARDSSAARRVRSALPLGDLEALPTPDYLGTPDYDLRMIRSADCRPTACGDSVYANGCLCFTVSHMNVPPTLMLPTTVWYGARSGSALRNDNDPSTINCGGFSSFDLYRINLNLPECAPWLRYY
jgi:hypothetical protein